MSAGLTYRFLTLLRKIAKVSFAHAYVSSGAMFAFHCSDEDEYFYQTSEFQILNYK